MITREEEKKEINTQKISQKQLNYIVVKREQKFPYYYPINPPLNSYYNNVLKNEFDMDNDNSIGLIPKNYQDNLNKIKDFSGVEKLSNINNHYFNNVFNKDNVNCNGLIPKNIFDD